MSDGHLQVFNTSLIKIALVQLFTQFPISKYKGSLHLIQLLLLLVGPSLQFLQFSWHLSIVLSTVSLQ